MFLYPAVCENHTNSLRGYRFSSGGQARIAVVAGFGCILTLFLELAAGSRRNPQPGWLRYVAHAASVRIGASSRCPGQTDKPRCKDSVKMHPQGFSGARLLTSSLRFASPCRGRLSFASPRRRAGLRLRGGEAATAAQARGSASAWFPSPHGFRLERFQLLRSAGFPACGFRRLSSRLFRADQTRDKNVPQTRRQECLRYIKVATALGTATARQADETSRRDRRSPHQNSTRIPKLNFCVGGVRPSRPQQRGMDRRLENVPWLEGSKLLHPGDGCTPAWPRPGRCFEQPIMPWVQLMK